MAMLRSLWEFGIEPSELTYRAEGNFTLVAAYQKTRQVLRFRKAAGPQNKDHSSPLTQEPLTLTLKNPNSTCTFVRTVMQQLLGTQFIPSIEVLHVNTASLEQINSQMRPWRPERRLAKDIDVGYHEVTVTCDVASLPPEMDAFLAPGSDTLCVEIKAKQGFVAPSSTLMNSRARSTWCRFCLMQFHPKKRCAILSEYCPCDLFSGDKARMMNALRGLLRTPQNNLQVFRNGQPLYQEGSPKDALNACLRDFFATQTSADPVSAAVGSFIETIHQVLTREFESTPTPPITTITTADNATVSSATEFSKVLDNSALLSQKCARLQPALASHRLRDDAEVSLQPSRLNPNCVLGRILTAQRLDNLGAKGTLADCNLVETFLQENGAVWDSSNGSLTEFVSSLGAPPPVTQSARNCDAYLTALVAKDCSIMLTFAPSRVLATDLPSTVTHVIDPATGRCLIFSIAVVDLDPKSLDKIRLNYKEELEALACYEATTASAVD